MKVLSLLVLVLAGAALMTQSVINSQLRGALHGVTWAVLIAYLVGSLAAVVLVVNQKPMPSLATFSALKWYQWIRGALGMVYLAAITFSLQRVGAASLFALVVTGQLFTALCYDQFGLLGLHRNSFSLTMLAGVTLLVAGAYLLNRK